MDMLTFTPMVAEINRGANVTGGTIYGTCLLGKSVVGAHFFFILHEIQSVALNNCSNKI